CARDRVALLFDYW
nr:immunoglobulin heavy chain junction region [Macaca mulatta]MOV35846.1 immunoglobulin heavy chain junction region [Macaca mulatta]MOV36035.1 immunoglobulin heavy chain junction region [Macaca mulatta]MOV36078.1 immunoglobulin heavy chain junction region [Macaca mulatta]MOV36101.1 immunoglobulin heavy chain junction region [Macaca mulatta]